MNRPSSTPTSILLLDDQALVRAGMHALIELSEPQAVICEAAGYDEALTLLESTPIDIAFLDIDLKDRRSGIDVLKQLRAGNLTTRAIMLSAISDEAMMMECLRLGASGYILKDMQGDGLFRQALDTIFEGGIFLPGHVPKGTLPRRLASTLEILDQMGVRGRAVEVLYYICQGLPNKIIAYEMKLAESTITNEYNTRLFRQFRVTNRANLIVEVARRGLTPPPPRKAC